jgi:hypothetical protein
VLALRTSGIAELIVATAATLSLATVRPTPAKQPLAVPVTTVITTNRPTEPSVQCWDLAGVARDAYVTHAFATAASLLPDECAHTGAQLLVQLDRLWRTAQNGDLDERYHALVNATAIDLTFGGILAGEIDHEERVTVRPLARQLVEQHRCDEAESVISFGKLLGVDMPVATCTPAD